MVMINGVNGIGGKANPFLALRVTETDIKGVLVKQPIVKPESSASSDRYDSI